ncbi:MAG: hypothetical protein GY793_06480 [Proteobacteria bacterium]|nr:hypothetical protein [Pseudomonadota bacterium]
MIKKFINSIAIDKKDHIILGIIIGFPLVLFFGNIGGYIAIALVGLKEVWHDWRQGKGNPEWLDFIASAIPIIMFLILNNK